MVKVRAWIWCSFTHWKEDNQLCQCGKTFTASKTFCWTARFSISVHNVIMFIKRLLRDKLSHDSLLWVVSRLWSCVAVIQFWFRRPLLVLIMDCVGIGRGCSQICGERARGHHHSRGLADGGETWPKDSCLTVTRHHKRKGEPPC